MASNDDAELKESSLSPEVRRIRNSIIKKFAHEPLDVMAKFVKDVVENENDTVKRLGAMAARVEILRMRISQISNDSNEANFDEVTDEILEENDDVEESSSDIVITSPNLSDWVRLRIIENSEINGVRFPKGVVIDVSQEDGDRLLESGKANYVEEDEISDVKSDISLQSKKQLGSADIKKEAPEKIFVEGEGLDSKTETSDGTLDGETEISDSGTLVPDGSMIEPPEDKEFEMTEDTSNLEPQQKKPKKKVSGKKFKDSQASDADEENTSSSASIKTDDTDDMLAGFDIESEDPET